MPDTLDIRIKSPCGTQITKSVSADGLWELQETIIGSSIPLSAWANTALNALPSTIGDPVPAGSTLYLNVGAEATASAFSVDQTLILWIDPTISTYVRVKITAITLNGASSYLTVLTLDSGAGAALLDLVDMARAYFAFPFPYNRDEVKYLFIHSTGAVSVSSNDVFDGSPDDTFSLAAGEYVEYMPDDTYNQTDPFSSADVTHLYFANGSGVGTDATVTVFLGTVNKRD